MNYSDEREYVLILILISSSSPKKCLTHTCLNLNLSRRPFSRYGALFAGTLKPEVAEARGLLKVMWELMCHCWKQKPSHRIHSDKLRTDLVDFAIFPRMEIQFEDYTVTNFMDRIDPVFSLDKKDQQDSTKRGWFDYVWNVELNVIWDIDDPVDATARVLDSSRLQADKYRVRIP